MRTSASKLMQLNQETEFNLEKLVEYVAKSECLMALAEMQADNPTNALFHMPQTHLHKGVLEGEEKLKAPYYDLEKWLNTFGYAHISFSNFVLDTNLEGIAFEVVTVESEAPESDKYAQLVTEMIRNGPYSFSSPSVFGLKVGRYSISCNKPFVRPVNFEISGTDTIGVIIQPDYWFRLLLMDENGRQYNASDLIMYWYGQRFEPKDLHRLPFGRYSLHGGDKLIVPDSLTAIDFRIPGSSRNHRKLRAGERIEWLEHGGYFELKVKRRSRKFFLLRWLGALVPF